MENEDSNHWGPWTRALYQPRNSTGLFRNDTWSLPVVYVSHSGSSLCKPTCLLALCYIPNMDDLNAWVIIHESSSVVLKSFLPSPIFQYKRGGWFINFWVYLHPHPHYLEPTKNIIRSQSENVSSVAEQTEWKNVVHVTVYFHCLLFVFPVSYSPCHPNS